MTCLWWSGSAMPTDKLAGLTSSFRLTSMRFGMNRAKEQFSVPRETPRASGKSATKDTLIRQWEILRRIPARGCGITISELAEMLKNECDISVTHRTVERD